jgi:hypothetical protein
MKQKLLKVMPIALTAVLFLGSSPGMAAKPQKAIEMGNGMPSGYHETLLFHGKKDTYNCIECDPANPLEECNVVNIPEYDTAPITYVSGRKVNISALTVYDSCAGFAGVDDSAEIWLPYEADGYYVFARALGKPGKTDDERYIIFENESLEAYPLLTDVSSPDDVVLGLGMITQQGEFKMDASGEIYRFDEGSDKGKGKPQAKFLTDMFLWSGLVFHPDLDVTGDGVVNELDVIAAESSYDFDQNGIIDNFELLAWADANPDPDDITVDGVVDSRDVIAATCPSDANQDGVISYDGNFDQTTFPDNEFEDWLAVNTVNADGEVLWQYYDEKWVFSIADLVYLNQVVTNNGIKNIQLRFYPVATTEFEAPAE